MQLIDATTRFLTDAAGRMVIHRKTDIDSAFLSDLSDARLASSAPCRSREMERVCSVPTILADKWLNEGFNIYEAKPRDILARLRSEGYEALITTSKNV